MGYKETKAAVKELVESKGFYNINGRDIVELLEKGYSATNIQNALSYFNYSPKAAKYRR